MFECDRLSADIDGPSRGLQMALSGAVGITGGFQVPGQHRRHFESALGMHALEDERDSAMPLPRSRRRDGLRDRRAHQLMGEAGSKSPTELTSRTKRRSISTSSVAAMVRASQPVTSSSSSVENCGPASAPISARVRTGNGRRCSCAATSACKPCGASSSRPSSRA